MEEGLSTAKNSYEAGKRPKKAKRRGSGNYCCVPNCKSTQYNVDNKAKIKIGIVFFYFIFQKTQKEERNGFKVDPDFREEEGKTNSM